MFARCTGTVALVVSALLSGCATVPPPPPYAARYGYRPRVGAGGKGISIALVKPQYPAATAAIFQATGQEPPNLRALNDALARSLLQYFNANGFTVSGPFAKVDDMTFPEKKQADLLLSAEVNVEFAWPSGAGMTRRSGWDGSLSVNWVGDCGCAGTISFVIWEPLSMQRMWSKSVDIPKRQIDCTFEGDAKTADIVGQNQQARLFEQVFPSVMATAERYFNAEEMALVKQQTKELREKKVYQ